MESVAEAPLVDIMVVSKVRVARGVPLGELADRAAEARAERSGVRFNSSI
jgi:hypothetical protein